MDVIEVELVEVVTDTEAIVEIDSTLPEITVDITKSISVEVQPETYVLTSGGIYTGNVPSSVPTWLINTMQQLLTTGTGDITAAIQELRDALDLLEVGVNQHTTSILTTNESFNALETSVVSRLNDNEAAILDIYTTKVDAAGAGAIAASIISSTFGGNADAYIANIASVYTNANSAIAANIEQLYASYNNTAVSITALDEVAVKQAAVYSRPTNPSLDVLITLKGGDYWIDTDHPTRQAYQWNGASWDLASTDAVSRAVVWSANSSKLITDPNGNITGWAMSDSSTTASEFKVYADNFIIQGATNPIEYDNSAIVLPKTYEQSSAPTSGMLIGDTWIDTDDSYKVYTYTSTGWKAAIGNNTYAQISAPTSGMIANDVWYDTDDNNKPYYYTGSVWSAIRDGTIATAQATANSAQSAATTAYNAAIARVLPEGVANAINTNTTTINGSKITTGSIYANALNVNALSGVKGLFTRATNPSAGDYGEALAAIQQSGAWCLSGRNDTSSGDAVGVAGVSTASSTGIGVYGHSKAYGVVGVTTSGTGQWGLFTNQKAYAGGGYSPFTGSHIVYSKDILEVGDICSVADSWVINVNQACVWVDKTMVANDKKVIGVVNHPNLPLLTNIEHNTLFIDKLEDGTYSYKPEYLAFITGMIEDNFTEVCINSLGEGAINVNSENGNIEIGDYICSSNIPGKGMKQNDDILHNYTVAKALESVDWSVEPTTTKMIACTYHCG